MKRKTKSRGNRAQDLYKQQIASPRPVTPNKIYESKILKIGRGGLQWEVARGPPNKTSQPRDPAEAIAPQRCSASLQIWMWCCVLGLICCPAFWRRRMQQQIFQLLCIVSASRNCGRTCWLLLHGLTRRCYNKDVFEFKGVILHKDSKSLNGSGTRVDFRCLQFASAEIKIQWSKCSKLPQTRNQKGTPDPMHRTHAMNFLQILGIRSNHFTKFERESHWRTQMSTFFLPGSSLTAKAKRRSPHLFSGIPILNFIEIPHWFPISIAWSSNPLYTSPSRFASILIPFTYVYATKL